MSGSGNDFVFIDSRNGSVAELETRDSIDRICSRTAGVGADGVVFLDTAPRHAFAIRYFNKDGSRGELCGNASLCAVTLAVRLGLANPLGFEFSTDVGAIAARLEAGEPEIDLQPSHSLNPNTGITRLAGEERIGFVDTGVPHLVVLVGNAEAVDLWGRGSQLRRHPTLAAGANVNFVSRFGLEWRMRTFERGVEGETLACGTGSAATAILLAAWSLAGPVMGIRTSSGRLLTVTLGASTGSLGPSLRGEGRLVFEGRVVDL